MSLLDPVRGSGSNVNQHTREGSRRRGSGGIGAPHGTHLVPPGSQWPELHRQGGALSCYRRAAARRASCCSRKIP